jgi:hypothetical protein
VALVFYPYSDDVQKGTLDERIALLMEAAERFKAVVLDTNTKTDNNDLGIKRTTPRDLTATYNWEEISRVLREIRELPEINKADKAKKGDLLAKLAEVYEVLRAAKMPKLEAVRLALMGEATQLRSASSQIA